MKLRNDLRTASVHYRPQRDSWRVRLYARDASLSYLTCYHGGRDLTYHTKDRHRAEVGARLFVDVGAEAFGKFWFGGVA